MKRSFIKKMICFFLCVVTAFSATGCGESKEYQTSVYALNTTMTLTAYGKKGEAALTSARATIAAIAAMADPDIETSTCYALNHAQGEQINISGQVAEMLLDAKEIYERSGGVYDITCYPLSVRWGFTDGHYYVPSSEEISKDLALLCMDKLVISRFPTSGTYAVQMPSYGSLSFASCARGCAANYAIDAMRKNGCESGIVSFASNVQTLGLRPDGSNWNIGVTDPSNPSAYLGILELGETAVCTTGAYQNTMPSNPNYHHILNTASGYPTNNGLLSVTVVCSDGTYADCLSTAMYALGQTKALNYWRQYGGFDMVLVTSSGNVICTSGLLEKFEIRNANYTLSYVE